MRTANACSDIMEEDSNVSQYSYSRSSNHQQTTSLTTQQQQQQQRPLSSSSSSGRLMPCPPAREGTSRSVTLEHGDVRFTIELPGRGFDLF